MKIRFSKLSKQDYDLSIEYYKKEGENLVLRFKGDIKQSLKRIETFPNLYPKVNDRVQKCVVSRFPYTVYYTTKDKEIYILAIANHYKNPEEYSKRFI